MNENERKNIAKLWNGLALMYGRELHPSALSMMLNAIENLDASKVEKSLNDWARESKLGRHPFPAEIIEKINPQIDKRAMAIELAHKIDKCINKHGYAWAMGHMQNGVVVYRGAEKKDFPTWKAAVISEVGEVGYHAICFRGDWQKTCESANESEEQFFIAQMRDQIVSTITLREQGVDITQIEMPKANEQLSSPTKDLFAHLGLSTKEFPSIKKLPQTNDEDV